MKNLIVVGPKDSIPDGFSVINTTSQDKIGLGKYLSPFYLGPVKLYENNIAKNLENAWQFSKVYSNHFNELENKIKEDYFVWSKKGWSDNFAHRYPMGKGLKPLFSFWKTFNKETQIWEDVRFDYISARINIYIPLYAKLVYNTKAFSQLKSILLNGDCLALWDFDGYNFNKKNMTFKDVIFEPKYKCGHAFVIYGLLTNQIIIQDDNVIFNFL